MSKHIAFVILSVFLAAVRANAQTTALFFDSQPGDYIGQGETHTWTEADFTFSASVSPERSRVTISTNVVDSNWWTLHFAGPVGTPLGAGLYEPAGDYPFQPPHLNGISVSGTGRGCVSAGRFHIYELSISPSGEVERFAADFEQQCRFRTAALFGAIRYRSTRASLVPFEGAYPDYSVTITPALNGRVVAPGIDCGGGRTDCTEAFLPDTTIALQAVPDPGFAFVGWSGFDCEGLESIQLVVRRRALCSAVFEIDPESGATPPTGGTTTAAYLETSIGFQENGSSKRVFAAPASRLSIGFASPSRVEIRIDDARAESRTFVFAAPSGAILAPGLYQPSSHYFDHGMDPRLGVDRLCESGGRFMVHEIRFVSGVLTAFSADFEAPCGLAGSIRFNAQRDRLLPFDGAYPRHTLTVVASTGGYVTGGGISCGDGGRATCEAVLESPGIASLQAIPSSGYEFLGWSGFCSGRTAITTVTVPVAKRCVAIFHPASGSPAPPSSSFGEGTVLIHRQGTTSEPELSMFTTPDAIIAPAIFSRADSVQINALSMWAPQFLRIGGAVSLSVGFTSPGGRLDPGEYLVDASDTSSTAPRVNVDGCSPTVGSFKVYESTFDTSGAPTAFAADFELYCSPSSDTKYLAGSVRYRSSRDAIRPYDGAYPARRLFLTRSLFGTVTGPGIACGHASTDCDETYPIATRISLQAIPKAGYKFVGWAGSCQGGSQGTVDVDQTRRCEPLFGALRPGTVPEDPRLAAGTIVIQSESGDPVGNGERTVRLTDSWSISASGAISGFVWGDTWQWQFEFRPPSGQVIAPGTYESAMGLGVNPRTPGLSIARSFSTMCPLQLVRGRFVVHELTMHPTLPWQVASLAVDFEQTCGNAPSLRGSIRWRSTRSEIEPFAGDLARVYTRFDFNSDTHPDLLWQNRQDGRLLIWNMDRSSHFFDQPPSIHQVPDTDWHVVGRADANRDGYDDLYWQHQATGALAIWLMRDAMVLSGDSMSPASVPDTNWKVRTVVDLDRDGHPDLIWQHRLTGQIAVWYMSEGTLRSGELLGPGAVPDTNWTIVGAGHADDDGYPDLYWHHLGTGQLAIWFMRGTLLLRGDAIAPSSVADTNWRVRGVADLDRNGSADLVWQHVGTSELAVWMLSGLRLIDGRHITGPVMPADAWFLVGPR